MNRSCLNCKYGDWQETHVPCEFCCCKDHWTPKQQPMPLPKGKPTEVLSCQLCKHRTKQMTEEPCNNCFNYDEFQEV